MKWKCPSCGYDENNLDSVRCICGQSNEATAPILLDSQQNDGASYDGKIVDRDAIRNIRALKLAYPVFAAAIILVLASNPSAKFIVYLLLFAAGGISLYKYKNKKTIKSTESDTPDFATFIASSSHVHGSLKKNELIFLLFIVVVIPIMISFIMYSKRNYVDFEKFLAIAFLLAFFDTFIGFFCILFKRTLKINK